MKLTLLRTLFFYKPWHSHLLLSKSFRQTKPVLRYMLVRGSERIFFCNPYFVAGTQIAWELRYCWVM